MTLARLLTQPPHSLYEQAWQPARQQHGTVEADGFGVGWYPEETDTPKGDAWFPRPPATGARCPSGPTPTFPSWLGRSAAAPVPAAVRSATESSTQEESPAAPFRGGRY
ncbi:class II glutamine amidotransferase domain-containing protein [Streptomyces cellulosae]|uniref:Uncharacterized protein n=1 Tax=Streptomyces cellulosae TaxID=1968 RepID=A0ABW7YGR5_STRCE